MIPINMPLNRESDMSAANRDWLDQLVLAEEDFRRPSSWPYRPGEHRRFRSQNVTCVYGYLKRNPRPHLRLPPSVSCVVTPFPKRRRY
jgi:hypothetical protein